MTKLRVAVWDPLPVYRQGMVAALGGTSNSSYHLEEPTDLVSWAGRKERRVVLMTIESAQDLESLKRIGRLERKPIVVTLLDDLSTEACIKALSAGAIGVVARNAEPEEIRQALDQALKGRTTLPVTVVTALIARSSSREEVDQPSERDTKWLKDLSQGVTVARLAETMGYSERAMYRLLRDLYRRMDVRNRTEAVLKAAQSGWI